MAGYENFFQSLQEICDGHQPEVQRAIDGYEINIRSMLYGYYLCGKLPVKWNGSEQNIQRHLSISMSCFNDFDASLSMGQDNTFYISQFIEKPKMVEELLHCVESLVNQIDVWMKLEISVTL